MKTHYGATARADLPERGKPFANLVDRCTMFNNIAEQHWCNLL